MRICYIIFRTALEADGHSLDELDAAFKKARATNEVPSLVIAHTVKGKGVSFMENRVEWHHKVPTQEEYVKAVDELNTAESRGVA